VGASLPPAYAQPVLWNGRKNMYVWFCCRLSCATTRAHRARDKRRLRRRRCRAPDCYAPTPTLVPDAQASGIKRKALAAAAVLLFSFLYYTTNAARFTRLFAGCTLDHLRRLLPAMNVYFDWRTRLFSVFNACDAHVYIRLFLCRAYCAICCDAALVHWPQTFFACRARTLYMPCGISQWAQAYPQKHLYRTRSAVPP